MASFLARVTRYIDTLLQHKCHCASAFDWICNWSAWNRVTPIGFTFAFDYPCHLISGAAVGWESSPSFRLQIPVPEMSGKSEDALKTCMRERKRERGEIILQLNLESLSDHLTRVSGGTVVSLYPATVSCLSRTGYDTTETIVNWQRLPPRSAEGTMTRVINWHPVLSSVWSATHVVNCTLINISVSAGRFFQSPCRWTERKKRTLPVTTLSF